MKRISILVVSFLAFCASVSVSAQSVIEYQRRIDRHGANFYWDDDNVRLTDDECLSILDLELYTTYKSAQEQFNKGKSWLSFGIVCGVASVLIASRVAATNNVSGNNDNKGLRYGAMALAVGADVGMCLGFVYRGIGQGRMEWVKDTYNSSRPTASRLSLSPSLMLTAQRDLGYGATLSLTF